MVLTGFIDEIDQNFIEELNIAKSLSLNYIELRSINGINIAEIPINDIYHIKQQLFLRDLKVSSIASPIGKIDIIADNFEQHYKKFLHVVNIAKILNVKYIRIFSFFINSTKKKNYKNIVLQRLYLLLEAIENTDIILIHENEKNIYGDTINNCLELFTTINHPKFKMAFDMANFVQIGENPIVAFKQLQNYIEYIHLKDAVIYSNENVLLGTGNGQIKEILLLLIQSNYQGFISLEPHLINFKILNQLELENITERKVKYTNGKSAFILTYNALIDILNDIGGKHLC